MPPKSPAWPSIPVFTPSSTMVFWYEERSPPPDFAFSFCDKQPSRFRDVWDLFRDQKWIRVWCAHDNAKGPNAGLSQQTTNLRHLNRLGGDIDAVPTMCFILFINLQNQHILVLSVVLCFLPVVPSVVSYYFPLKCREFPLFSSICTLRLKSGGFVSVDNLWR